MMPFFQAILYNVFVCIANIVSTYLCTIGKNNSGLTVTVFVFPVKRYVAELIF